jgi:molybdopterin-guanine dinucleotide biosynthesis protein
MRTSKGGSLDAQSRSDLDRSAGATKERPRPRTAGALARSGALDDGTRLLERRLRERRLELAQQLSEERFDFLIVEGLAG